MEEHHGEEAGLTLGRGARRGDWRSCAGRGEVRGRERHRTCDWDPRTSSQPLRAAPRLVKPGEGRKHVGGPAIAGRSSVPVQTASAAKRAVPRERRRGGAWARWRGRRVGARRRRACAARESRWRTTGAPCRVGPAASQCECHASAPEGGLARGALFGRGGPAADACVRNDAGRLNGPEASPRSSTQRARPSM